MEKDREFQITIGERLRTPEEILKRPDLPPNKRALEEARKFINELLDDPETPTRFRSGKSNWMPYPTKFPTLSEVDWKILEAEAEELGLKLEMTGVIRVSLLRPFKEKAAPPSKEKVALAFQTALSSKEEPVW